MFIAFAMFEKISITFVKFEEISNTLGNFEWICNTYIYQILSKYLSDLPILEKWLQ